MAYNELVKKFSRIRDYMREFYIYCFKSRDEYKKAIKDIIDVISDSVEFVDIIEPVLNFKASDEDLPWRKKRDTDKNTILDLNLK